MKTLIHLPRKKDIKQNPKKTKQKSKINTIINCTFQQPKHRDQLLMNGNNPTIFL